ncbi:hypothetical protein ARALYDRAFT_896485 [Arabidopsis lyrata subsp. lyrata]|uniref:Neprosin PEP catalytic domain-containing protein n=1 Tax=Arabidopsis lyrata subsp. lyrata TaxID=81972 RepID=D7L264_ARALL|nr:hypothetical protein ARALYDRAFT_896485 [Arabidopsis lyrata subsp. lyrata]
MVTLCFCLALTLCVTVGFSTTIQSPDGDIVDCTDILAQPAFRHPLLKDHKLQETPKNLPNLAKDRDELTWQTWHRSGSTCPEGTIPIRREVGHENGTTNSRAGAEVTQGHEYAIGYLNSTMQIYGTKVTMSVGHPKVDQVREFSLGQLWLVAGSYKKGDLNSIEAGWQVFPGLYSDFQPRFFIFWTRDAYTRYRCYNLQCAGFVQTSGTVLIEGAISLMSPQITIQIWKDPHLGHWWLSIGSANDTVLTPVGYWPTEIFTCLSDYAERVQWGGEIVNTNFSGRHTTTQMGSGYLPSSAKAAYMRDLEIVTNNRDFQPTDDLIVGTTNPAYYDIKKSSNTSFSYGGPMHAGAVHIIIDSIVFYFCISLFLLF